MEKQNNKKNFQNQHLFQKNKTGQYKKKLVEKSNDNQQKLNKNNLNRKIANKANNKENVKKQEKTFEFLNLFGKVTKKNNENNLKNQIFLPHKKKLVKKLNKINKNRVKTKETLTFSHFNLFWHSKTYAIFQELVKKKIHIGQHKKYLNTNMTPYLFGCINNFCFIDLNHTIKQLKIALKILFETVLNGGTVAILGTKNAHLDNIELFANYLGLPYTASTKWLGGSLTNFDTIEKNFEDQQRNKKKKNTVQHNETQNNEKNLSNISNKTSQKKLNLFRGLENMGPADVLIVLNPLENQIALNEARVLSIPVIGILDTNTPFHLIDYPIVANNESLISLSYFLQLFNLTIRSAMKKKAFLETVLKNRQKFKKYRFNKKPSNLKKQTNLQKNKKQMANNFTKNANLFIKNKEHIEKTGKNKKIYK